MARSALLLGYESPESVFALTRDVDAVFWIGQGEDLLKRTNFWEAVSKVNAELSADGLDISHFFEETQVILTQDWRSARESVSVEPKRPK